MAAAAPVLGKMLVSAAVGKVVGKVTGNDKLGMLAGMATGIGMAGGFNPSDAATTTSTSATGALVEPGVTGIGVEGVKGATGSALSTVGEKTSGLLTSAADWTKENPYGAIIGAQTVGGAVNVYEQRKIAEEQARQQKLDRELQRELQTNTFQENQRDYDRTHQDWGPVKPRTSPFARRAGILDASGAAPAPSDPASDYFAKYRSMYQGGVR